MGGLRQAECEYRGITASFEDVTRAYLVEAYEGGRIVRWEGRAGSGDPGTQTLVTAWCQPGSPRPVSDYELPDSIRALRAGAGELAPVTWRYSTLGAVRIEAANLLAQDALAVFRFTVDRFVRSMAVTSQSLAVRAAADPEAPVVRWVDANAVLLREDPPAAAATAGGWSYVRVPSTPDRGWVEADKLTWVSDER